MAREEPTDLKGLRQSANSAFDATAKRARRAGKASVSAGRKAVDATVEIGKKSLSGLKEGARTFNNARQARGAKPRLSSGSLLGPAVLAAPAVVETGKAISQVSRARDEGVPVSRSLAFRRNLEAIPGALVDAGSTVVGGLLGTAVGGPGVGTAAGGMAGFEASRRGRKRANRLVNAGLDKVFGTDLSTQDYSAEGQIEAAREDRRRAADRKLLQDEGVIPGPQAAVPATIGDSGIPNSGNTRDLPEEIVPSQLAPASADVQTGGPSATFADGTPRNLGRDPNDPRVGALNYTLDRARLVGERNSARDDKLAAATIQTANTKLASEQRAAQTAIDTKRRNAQADLDTQVERFFPEEKQLASFSEFLSAMNPTAEVAKGLLTKEQLAKAEKGATFAELLVDLRVRDPQKSNEQLAQIIPLFELYGKQQGGRPGQGLGNITGEGVPDLFTSDPDAIDFSNRLGANVRGLFGGGKFIQLDDGSQIDPKDVRGIRGGAGHVARGLALANKNRELLDAKEGRKLAIASAKKRFGLQ